MRTRVLLLVACGVLAPWAALAQELGVDEEGCKDSTLLTRMPGCSIRECSGKEFDAAEVHVGHDETKALEGRTEILAYMCPTRISLLQIARNAEGALRKAGFTIVWSGANSSASDWPRLTARKGAQWVQVAPEPYYEYSGYVQTAVKVQEMAQEMEGTADSLAEEIGKSGHVAVYGIHFDTGSSSLKPESDKALAEIATLLKKNPAWKIRVEGHTDNVGNKAANRTLSEQRAAAVVAWLVKNGASASRLAPQGFGDGKPIADNATEEGRARNRRVELVKLP